MFDWLNFFPPLLSATSTTVFLALASLMLGLLLAFLFATLEMSALKPIALTVSVIVTIVRSLPEILVVITVYLGLQALLQYITYDVFNLSITINISPIFYGIIALSLLYAAYASQTLRSAFKAVPIGQRQAAEVLGLSKARIFSHIIIPQIWRHALPGLGNQWLVLLKDTALVSLITINDLMMQTRSIISGTHDPFTWYLIAAAIYLAISLLSQKLLQKLEKKVLYFETTSTVTDK